MKSDKRKAITDDIFMKLLKIICYISMIIALISTTIIGVTTQELISSCASMVILTMFTLILIFFTIIIFAYNTELNHREKNNHNNHLEDDYEISATTTKEK